MNAEERANLFTVRMSDFEMEMLRRLADVAGLSASDYVRQFIRSEHGRLPPALPPPLVEKVKQTARRQVQEAMERRSSKPKK
jgi:hypothetical protein